MPLTGKQIRHLRSLGHHLEPVVQIGKNGITEALVAQIGDALLRHELIKVKLLPECPIDRHEAATEVAKAAGAELAQMLGKTLLLWKRNPQASRIELPRQASAKKKREAAKEALEAARAAAEAAMDDDDEAPKPPVRRAPESRIPSRGARPAPRGDRPAPRSDRGDRPAPRGDRPAPRSDRGDRPAPRSARPGEKRPYNRDRRVDDRAVDRGEPSAKSRPRAPGRAPARRGPPRKS